MEPPINPERFKRVTPLFVGRSIVATWEPNEKLVLKPIREHGLELQIVFNKGAVMVLPPGVNKASGLKAALEDCSHPETARRAACVLGAEILCDVAGDVGNVSLEAARINRAASSNHSVFIAA